MTDGLSPEGACTRKATPATNLLRPGFTLSKAVMNLIFQPHAGSTLTTPRSGPENGVHLRQP